MSTRQATDVLAYAVSLQMYRVWQATHVIDKDAMKWLTDIVRRFIGDTDGKSFGVLQAVNEGAIIVYTAQAKTSRPAKWTRKGRCPSCRVSGNCRHRKDCKVVYVRK